MNYIPVLTNEPKGDGRAGLRHVEGQFIVGGFTDHTVGLMLLVEVT